MADGLHGGAGRDPGFFLDAPDDVPRPAPIAPGSSRRAQDLLSDLYEFQLRYGRKPDSWRDFQYGLGNIARATAREMLQDHEAFFHTQVKNEARAQWLRATRKLAGD